MSNYSELQGFTINKMSKQTWDGLKASGSLKSNEVYLVYRGEDPTGLPSYQNKSGYILKVNANGTDVEWQKDINDAAIFPTLSSMVSSLNNENNTKYAPGQSVFIAEQNVPDFWIYSVDETYTTGTVPQKFDNQFYKFGYYTLALLEVGKAVFNSNITYSETEPTNSQIGDIWLAPAEEFEMVSELPEYSKADSKKYLRVNTNGDLEWNQVDAVKPNPDLDGTEPVLNSIVINDVKYKIESEPSDPGTMKIIFSDKSAENANSLRSITIDEDVWNVQEPLVSGVNIRTINGVSLLGNTDIQITAEGLVDLDGYATEEYVNSQGFIKTLDGYATEAWTTENFLLKNEKPNLTGYATEKYVDNRITDLIGGAPDTLDTLKEIAVVATENKTIVQSIENAILNKQDTLISSVNIKTINGKSIVGTGNLEIDTGSGVIPNPALTGLEEELTSIEIDDVKYSIPSGLLSLSSEPTTEGEALKTIRVGDYVWRIEGEKSSGGDVTNAQLAEYAKIKFVEENILELNDKIAAKQEQLVDDVNIKTINGESILGSGNIEIITQPEVNVDLTGYATENWANEKFATKGEIDEALVQLIADAPAEYDTLKELANAISDNEDLIQTLNNSITSKANKTDVVSLTGGQNIGGLKTFTGGVVLSHETLDDTSPILYLKSSNLYTEISNTNSNNEKSFCIKTYEPNFENYFSIDLGFNRLTYTRSLFGVASVENILTDINTKTINGSSIYGSGNIKVITPEDEITLSTDEVESENKLRSVKAGGVVWSIPQDSLPEVTEADNGKILAVVNGVWTAVSLSEVYNGTNT